MDPTDQALVNQYYLDSEFRKKTVTHSGSGITGAVCQGTWLTEKVLQSETGDSVVLVQRLMPVGGDIAMVGSDNSPIVRRAVKRLRSHRPYPETDNRLMIARGILFMARANLYQSIAVVRMVGWYEDDEFTYIAMEYYEHGNLFNFVSNSPIQAEYWARDVIKQILEVLAELAKAQLAHRNITPTNILIASTLPIQVRLGDFHNAKWMNEGNGPRTQVGTLPYIAPEMRGHLDEERKLAFGYDTKVDMWALGIILHEIMTKMHPFRDGNRNRFSEYRYQEFLRQDQPVSLSALEGKASIHAMSFVACMLARDPNLRPTPVEALCCPWFTHPISPV